MFKGCCSPDVESEPLLQVAQLPPARGDLPSAVLSVHTAFWLTPIVAILVYILEVGLTWRALAMGVAAMSIFVALFVIVILLAPQLGCYALSSALQVSLLQHPGCPLSQMVLPAIGSAQGMELCNNAYCHRLRDALGNNYCYAGMVSIGDYQVVEATLRSGQSRTALLGAQALTNLPKVDRDIFFLQMPNLDVNSLHERFVACFKHYMFSEGFAERMKSEKAARLWAQLAEDYRRMPHGPGEEFHKASDKGLRGFFIRYFFYVMIGLDPEDPEVMRTLVPLMQGDTPIGFAYLWPMARLGILNGYINEIDSRIYNSPALSDFTEGEERYGKMSKLELARLSTCIFRLAAITGTLQLAKSITGGLKLPDYKDMDKIDIPSQWDKLDLKDDVALQNFCYEVARLYPPVSAVHHIATEPFSIALQGTAVDFPAGTRILVPMNIAMTDKEVWGADAFEFNPSRPGLQERNMFFANVGATGSRVCPGAGIAIDTCVKILRVLGEVRRSHRHNS